MNTTKKQFIRKLYKEMWNLCSWKQYAAEFREFCGEVRGFVAKLTPTDEEKDEFYHKLVYAQLNGVSSTGQSLTHWPNDKRLSSKELHDFFKKEVFAKQTQTLGADRYRELRAAFFKKVGVDDLPLIFNRIIGALFPKEVTPIPDEENFEKLYLWMLDKGFIENNENADAKKDAMSWYEQNVAVLRVLNEVFDNETSPIDGDTSSPDEFEKGCFAWRIFRFISQQESPKSQVKYGAPGTGKTFTTESEAKLRFLGWRLKYGENCDIVFKNTYEFVQFHPSYGYEDFIEGLKPTKDSGSLALQDGNFKAFCRKAAKWECDLKKLGLSGKASVSDLAEKWEILKGDGQVPGHWKFLEGKIESLRKDATTEISDVLPPFTFVIDEINRAELSRVFGELMFCLEYRGWEYAIRTQYAQLDDKPLLKEIVKEDGEETELAKFFIPRNVYIVGTMNTIDKSVESFDYALRRRFRWIEVEPQLIEVVGNYLRQELKFKDEDIEEILIRIEELNKAIAKEQLLGPDYRIGQAYFMKVKKAKYLTLKKYLEEVWEGNIRPLLFEYLRGTGKEKKIGRGICLMDDFKEILFPKGKKSVKGNKEKKEERAGGDLTDNNEE